MTKANEKMVFWLVAAAVFFAALWLLKGVLLPFALGLLVAYFLDPLADRIEGWGVGRTLATCLILFSFVAVFVLALMLVFPVVQEQFSQLAAMLPVYIDKLRQLAQPFVDKMHARLMLNTPAQMTEAANGYAAKAFQWVGGLLGKIWGGGMAVLDILSVIFIAPVVSFYFLRDWDVMVKKVDGWLPRKQASVIRALAREMDAAVSGFVRGQALVCIVLGLIYGAALTMSGLNFGFLIGLGAGILSFIPYVGSIAGFIVAMLVGYFQYDGALASLLVIAAIFGIGQFVEGNFLTPKLVGDKVGLHGVWIIFALMAGGSLLGFAGVMIAVPVAAVIGVLVRFALREYLSSAYYTGKGA